jgi:hypothetical protein
MCDFQDSAFGHLQEAEWIIETSSNNPRRTRKVKVNLQMWQS